MPKTELGYIQLLLDAKKDPNILAVILTGSRGKGRKTKFSDYDVEVIVKDNQLKNYKNMSDSRHKTNDLDLCVHSYTGFKNFALKGSGEEWQRYSYTHLKAAIDKTGKVQKLIDEKGRMPKDEIRAYVSGNLDGYINAIYRSVKCFRDGLPLAAHLEAMESVSRFLRVMFAMDGGRLKPYSKYLVWELKKYPLQVIPMSSNTLISTIETILKDGNLKSQQKLFRMLETVARKNGYGKVFDSWKKEQLTLIKTFKIQTDTTVGR